MIATTDDPRVRELLERREARKSGPAPKRPKCGACFAPLDDDGVCTGCGSTTYATAKAPTHCPKCEGRINTFSGKCPRCDAKPVVVTPRPPEPEPRPAPQPYRPRIEPPPPNPNPCPRGCGKTVHRGRCGGLLTSTRAVASEAKPVRVERIAPEPRVFEPAPQDELVSESPAELVLEPEIALEPSTEPETIEPEAEAAPPVVAVAECRPPAECKAPAPDAARPWMPEGATFRFHQRADDCSPATDGNDLVVRVDDGGAGPYLVLKTRRWAMGPEEIDGLVATLRHCLAQCTGVRPDGED